MKILMLVTADYAAVEPQTGKLNVLGVFRSIKAPHFPAIHPRMYLVIQVAGEIADRRNPHVMSVTFSDEDGKAIASFEIPFMLPKAPPGIPSQHSVILELNGHVFQEPGDYVFEASVNKDETSDSTVIQVVKQS